MTGNENRQLGEAALALAREGFHVFPLVPDRKIPAIPKWPEHATNDPAVIEQWWREDPRRNIGIYTGRYGNAGDQALLVLDVDKKEGKRGAQSLASLDDMQGASSDWRLTREVRTASGGAHLYFAVPANSCGNTAGKLGSGLDTRSTGGYVVAPGSIVDGARYEVCQARPVIDAPRWLIDLNDRPRERASRAAGKVIEFLDGKQARARGEEYLRTTAPLAIEGEGGDNTTYRVAATLKDFGLSDMAALELMYLHWNGRCEPPWRYDELATKVANAYAYGREPIGARSAEADFRDLSIEAPNVVPLTPLQQRQWPEPIDLFGDQAFAGRPPLPVDCMPAALSDFAQDVASRLGVDVGMVAMPALVAAAACLHDGFVIQPKRHDTGWTESARLWLGVVAEPGSKKSPAIKAATDALRTMETEWAIEDHATRELHEREQRIYERAEENYVRAAAKGEATGQPPARPSRPPIRKLIFNDATIEALAESLSDNPRGMLGLYDELSGWIGSFDVYRDRGSLGRDRAKWLELFEGRQQAIDRVNRGRVVVPNWSASLIGAVQPDRMRDLAGKLTDDGLLQRFLFVWGGNTGPGEDRLPNREALDEYERVLRTLASWRPTDFDEPVRLSAEAHAERTKLATLVRALIEHPDTSPAYRTHLDKFEAMFARVLLTCHAIECATLDIRLLPEVEGRTARRAATLFRRYLLPHGAQFYSDVLGKQGALSAHGRWIAGHLLAGGAARISERDVGRAYRNLRGDKETIGKIMDWLETLGWVRGHATDGRRPVSRWDVNPKVHQHFAEEARRERERREAERQRIADAVAVVRGMKADGEAALG